MEPRAPCTASQLTLLNSYRALVSAGRTLPRLEDVGFSAYSQGDDDGILWFLLAVVGIGPRLAVEICAGDGIECNTSNLLINHGWHGLLVDGDRDNVERGRRFYRAHRRTYVFPPVFVQEWVTRGNVNALVSSQGFSDEVDVLSLDLDGVDYWVWEALDVIVPRIVVVEYQDVLGPDRALTVPYADDFDASRYGQLHGAFTFAGASLAAFVKLASRKGYRLVGVNRYGFNAFFLRNDLAPDLLPERQIASCFTTPKVRAITDDRRAAMLGHPWVEV